MMIRRIDDDTNVWPRNLCRDPEHNPPGMICLPPGLYEHECPRCGAKVRFRVPEPPMLSSKRDDATPFLDCTGPATSTGKVSFRVYESPPHTKQVIEWTHDEMPWSDA